MPNSLEGFILVGGLSSRMGTDKSRLILNGLTFTEHIARVLGQVSTSVKLVGKAPPELSLETTTDVFEHWGALGGLHAALASSRKDWALVVACDLPFVTRGLVERLIELRHGFEAVVPEQENGFLQPLCALYRVDPCLERCEGLIKAGERRPLALVQAVNSRLVKFEEISDLNDSDRFFDNINTPEDYAKAKTKGRTY